MRSSTFVALMYRAGLSPTALDPQPCANRCRRSRDQVRERFSPLLERALTKIIRIEAEKVDGDQ